MDTTSQVLGHHARVDGVYTDLLQGGTEVLQVSVVVQLGPVLQTTGPGKDTGDGVGAGCVALIEEGRWE